MDPATVMGRLWEIETDLAERQVDLEAVAESLARTKRDWDYRMAKALVVAQGASAEVRRANALLAIVAGEDDIYERLTDEEAKYGALKAAMGSLEARASIGQSILRSLTQEANRANVSPAWGKA